MLFPSHDLEGQIETRKYTDKNNIEKYVTEIVLRGFNGKLIMLDSRENNQDNNIEAVNQHDTLADLDDEIGF